VVRAPAGKQRFEHLALCWGFDQQSAEYTLQTVSVQPRFQGKAVPESVDVGRSNRHTADPQCREEIAKLCQ
jgi:hypothetical protein